MADAKISALPAAATLDGTEPLAGVQSGGNVKITVSQINTLSGSLLGANPTGVVGLTAVNGTATTFLRSDGAPALDQGIVPTWTGAHTFTPAANTSAITVNQSLSGSNAQSAGIYNITWNTSGNPIGFKIAITQTANGASSLPFQILGGASATTNLFKVDRLGGVTSASDITSGGVVTAASNFTAGSTGVISWQSRGGFTSPAAGTIQFGNADAASPVAQTIRAQSVVAGTSNTSGQDWTIIASKGTGLGNSGKIIFQTAPAGTTGTTQNTPANVLTLNSDKTITFSAYGTGVATFDSSGNIASTSTTGSGAVVLATSPSLTTPNLDSATAASINKVAITAPATSATLTIADGKTLTASNTLTFTGTDGSSVNFGAGGTVAYSTAVGANPTASVGLTAVNGSAGTFLRSDGAPALDQSIAPTMTGAWLWTPSAANTTPLKVTGFSLTGSNASSLLDLAGTLNTSGNADVVAVRMTSTAAGASTMLLNLYSGAAGATSRFSVRSSDGTVTCGPISSGSITSSGSLNVGSGNNMTFTSRSKMQSSVNGNILFQNNGGTTQAALSFPASDGTWQFGIADGATAVAQTLQAQSIVAGTSNTAGQEMIVQGSRGTGTGTAVGITVKATQAIGSGTTQQTAVTCGRFFNGAFVLTNYTVATLPSASTTGAGAIAFVTDASTTLILGFGTTVVGGGANKVPVFSDGTNWIIG